MMKRTYRNRMAIALLSATGLFALAACDKDSDGLLPGTPVESLTIDTHVNGYVPEGAAAGTRASTSGNTFKFTTGDAIGLIALKNGSVSRYNNVKLTYNGGGRWSCSTDIYDFGGMSFIAYYPYRSDMAGKTSVDAIKSAFPIQDDQSTEANFNASNLMTSQTTASNGTLKFNFTPAFAMVEVTVPDAVKATASIDGKSYVYRIYGTESSSTTYTCNVSLFRNDKTLRRIVKPGTTTEIKISCGVDNIPCMTYNTKSVNIGAGNYKKLVLKGTMTRNLAIGDLAYNDGGTIAFFPGSATAVPTSNCLGAIWSLGPRSGDTPSNYDGKLSAIHGYVVALKPKQQKKFCTQNFTIGTAGQKSDPVTGYINTKKIRSMPGYSATTFPVCWEASNWSPSAPNGTSGWYLPALNEYESMFSNKGVIGTVLSKAGGNYLPPAVGSYMFCAWTSGESPEGGIYVHLIVYEYLASRWPAKTEEEPYGQIWPCLAF